MDQREHALSAGPCDKMHTQGDRSMSEALDDSIPASAPSAGAPGPLGSVCGLRARKKQQTRESLIECALDLFERHGYDATTIEEIAAAANVSPRTFFRYFDSKLDLIRGPKQEHPSLQELVAARPAAEGPVAAIHGVIRDMLTATLLTDALALRLVQVMLRTPSLRAAAMEHFHEHQADLAVACAARMGAAPDDLRPQVVAAAAGTTMWTVVDRWVTEGGEQDRLLPMLDEAFALLRAGMA
jgi:AcrR family transcriptional regulator